VRSLRHCTSIGVVKRIDESRSLKTLVRVDQVASTTRARLGQDTVCGCETFLDHFLLILLNTSGRKIKYALGSAVDGSTHRSTHGRRPSEPGSSLLKRT
jgi:hypothetical protein